MGTLALLGAGGGAIYGSLAGGMTIFGAMGVGLTVASLVSSMQPQRRTNPTNDIQVSGSAYDSFIPWYWGEGGYKLPGNIVYMARPYKTGGGGGGKKSPGNPDEFSADFLALICMRSNHNMALRRIWGDGEIIYEPGVEGLLLSDENVRVRPGDPDQMPDSLMVSNLGSEIPAQRGYFTVMVEGMPLAERFGNRMPTSLLFEVYTDAVNGESIIVDIYNAAKIESEHIEASDFTDNVRGFVILSQVAAKESVDDLLKGYPYQQVDAGTQIQIVELGKAVVLTVDEEDLGAVGGNKDTSGESDGKDEFEDEKNLPQRVEVSFLNPDMDFQKDSKAATKDSALDTNSRPFSLDTNLVLTGDEATALSRRYRDTAWLEQWKRDIALPFGSQSNCYLKLMPGDAINVPIKGRSTRFKVTRKSWGVYGNIELGLVRDDPTVLRQFVESSSGVVPTSPPPTTVLYPTYFDARSGIELTDLDATSPGFYVAASWKSDGRSRKIRWSEDGTNWVEAGTIPMSGTIGHASEVLPDFVTPEGLDTGSTTEVILSGGRLDTFDISTVPPNGLAFWGNEVLAYATAALQDTGIYDISNIVRGLRESPMTGHTNTDQFILADRGCVRVPVPISMIGSTLQVVVYEHKSDPDLVTPVEVTISTPTQPYATPDDVDEVATDLEDHRTASPLDHPDGSVITDKLAANAVTNGKLADNAVTTSKIVDTGVTAAKLATDSVETAKIKNANVTGAKLEDSGVSAGVYGDGSNIPVLTIDAKGRVTSATETPAPGGGGGGVDTDRDDHTVTTGTIAQYESDNTKTLDLGKTYIIHSIHTTKSARVRIYSTSAARTADASRPNLAPLPAGSGLVAEVITSPGDLTVVMDPPPTGHNMEGTVVDTAYLSVENLDPAGGTLDVTVNSSVIEQ